MRPSIRLGVVSATFAVIFVPEGSSTTMVRACSLAITGEGHKQTIKKKMSHLIFTQAIIV